MVNDSANTRGKTNLWERKDFQEASFCKKHLAPVIMAKRAVDEIPVNVLSKL